MTKRINAMTIRKNLGEVLEGVYYRGDEVIVERGGKPMGVLIPISQYDRIKQFRSNALAKIEAQWGKMPATDNLAAAEAEIAMETAAVRYGIA